MIILMEIQTTGEAAAVTPAQTFTTPEDALQAFYTACAYAVKSNVDKHTVIMVNGDGKILQLKTFNH